MVQKARPAIIPNQSTNHPKSMHNSTASLPQSLPKLITHTAKTQRLWNNLSADPVCLGDNLEIMLTHLSAVPDFLDRE